MGFAALLEHVGKGMLLIKDLTQRLEVDFVLAATLPCRTQMGARQAAFTNTCPIRGGVSGALLESARMPHKAPVFFFLQIAEG